MIIKGLFTALKDDVVSYSWRWSRGNVWFRSDSCSHHEWNKKLYSEVEARLNAPARGLNWIFKSMNVLYFSDSDAAACNSFPDKTDFLRTRFFSIHDWLRHTTYIYVETRGSTFKVGEGRRKEAITRSLIPLNRLKAPRWGSWLRKQRKGNELHGSRGPAQPSVLHKVIKGDRKKYRHWQREQNNATEWIEKNTKGPRLQPNIRSSGN